MPANKKYLNSSGLDKVLKITGGFFLGYSIILLLMLLSAYYWNEVVIWDTFSFIGVILWVGLFLVAFLMKKGWQVWLIYGSISLLLWGIYLLISVFNLS